MRDDYDDFNSIRNQVEKRIKKQQKAKSGLRNVTVVNAIFLSLVLIIPRIGIDEKSLPAINLLLLTFTIAAVIWGLYGLWRWFSVMVLEPRHERRYQEVVEQELERELAKRGLVEKRKNLALSDDGELVEITEDNGSLQQRGNEIYR